MKKIDFKVVRRFLGVMLGLIIIYLFFLEVLTIHQTTEESFPQYTGWTVQYNGITYTDVNLKEFEIQDIKEGDTISFSNLIPDYVYTNTTMYFNTYLSSVNVILNDSSIYQYGLRGTEAEMPIGSGCHFVTIPSTASGDRFYIVITAKEDNAFTNFETVKYIATNKAFTSYVSERASSFIISCFLTVLGIVISIIGALLILTGNDNYKLIYIGIFSFLLGVWSLNNIKALQIFNIPLGAATSTEYLSLYLAPIPFIFLVLDLRKGAPAYTRVIFKTLILVFTGFDLVATILHFTQTLHFSQLLGTFHVMVAVAIFLVFLLGIIKANMKDIGNLSVAIGFIILGIAFAADLIRFNVQKYFYPNSDALYNSFIPLGTLIFVLFLLYGYLYELISNMQEQKEQEILSYIAYHDDLTKIYNRAKCMEEFQSLDEEKGHYCLVSLDLNGLKHTNDTYGHQAGDALLSRFAEILSKSFEKHGQVYRVGGDEFVVIVKEGQMPFVPICIEEMQLLEKEASKEFDFTLDASYGIAYDTDLPKDVTSTEQVYSLADTRMYEMKVKAHMRQDREMKTQMGEDTHGGE